MRMRDSLRRLAIILGHSSLKKFVGLLVVIFFMAILEVAGVASVLPFMQLVMRPEAVEENRWLSLAYETVGFESRGTFLIAVGVAVLAFMTFANAFSAFTRWLQYRVTWSTAHALAKSLLEMYTSRPYSYFLKHNSADMAKQVLAEVNQFVNSVVYPATEMVARLLVSILIFALLILVDPLLALIAALSLGGVYVLVFLTLRRHLATIGSDRTRTVQTRFKSANEMLAGIKSIKIAGAEGFFRERFVEASRRYTNVQARYLLLGNAPRYLVEVVAFGGILAIVLYLLAVRQDARDVVPLLSLYALAGYRLLPSLQKLYNSFATLRYHHSLIDELYADMQGEGWEDVGRRVASALTIREPAFEEGIEVRSVTFRYLESDEVVLRDVSLRIPKGSRIALVGVTGSGKTTLADLVMGLLVPDEGAVLVDGAVLEGPELEGWKRLVGYVPQEVFLFDDTIARNIAFGIPADEIDRDRIRRVARIAQVDQFIQEDLPHEYDTFVGERGVRLSGGQRQRIGLARALYREPRILILDEATSALDGITEQGVMDAIGNLPWNMTMILVAHRLSTVRDCDTIYLLRQGRIAASGNYEELLARNATFRDMARLTT